MKTIHLFLIVILLAVGLAGCIAPPPVEEAEQAVETEQSEVCASIEAFAASIDALQQVTPDTTVAEFNALRDAAYQAYEDVVAEWADLQAAEVQVVESAVAEFQQSLDGVTPESTLGEIATEVTTEAATVKLAVDQLDQAACPVAQ
jgi:uncharacterized protein YcfL